MKQYYGYIRVSTAKQGTHGVSLIEQKSAIERYAAKNALTISEWFEERETAAKRGRPIFSRMLSRLRKGEAAGVLIHKIDRSARNLKDWADLGELIDAGVEVHFAADALDLASRGGRLSADIQAVVAADYIRNLREEAKKGLYGRLKQGIYPFRAPIGYLDQGGGKAKILDPATAPLVRRAFEIYGAGQSSLEALGKELFHLGLQRRSGGVITASFLSDLFNNSFYAGVIRIKRSGETFKGIHEPLVPWTLYERVQAVLKGKLAPKVVKHDFPFRKIFTCVLCGRVLVGERQKGRVYYRCHSRNCPTMTIREDVIDQAVRKILSQVQLAPDEVQIAKTYLDERLDGIDDDKGEVQATAKLSLDNAKARLDRLTNAFVDGLLEKPLFEERRASLLGDITSMEHRLANQDGFWTDLRSQIIQTLELAENVADAYDLAFPHEKRQILETVTSNRTVSRKELVITLDIPFQMLANRDTFCFGGDYRNANRTRESCRDGKAKLQRLVHHLVADAEEKHRRIDQMVQSSPY
ncbi:MAG: recombinase family protein [Terricaulis sp.]